MNNLRGAKIIYQESKATQPSHLYFLQKDANYCEVIATSESGVKRKLNLNVDLYTYYTKSETYSQTEITNFLNNKQNNLGYTPENVTNKSDSYTSNSSTTYASSRALVKGLATKLDKVAHLCHSVCEGSQRSLHCRSEIPKAGKQNDYTMSFRR